MFSPKIALAKQNLENIQAIRQNILNDRPYISRYKGGHFYTKIWVHTPPGGGI